ncbi:P-loop containing nucleoside triphosphate hydrolases superfamily protein [Perilla frutescens var. hirtella]|uniref:P-loop containing nucleoside triphosphate hydrolases superfamily protein n=1 Tax=Perilla frutescens var. hirtella TaxID=608512 RepID=A0AAD4JGH6_PERFH|nr:P-loop containing nucleoside triphosphate hydrolases superfamily protein [Perilla frutescens var. hirtella]
MKFFDSFGAQIGSLLLIVTTLERFFPDQFWATINRYLGRFVQFFNPYVEITFDEFPPESYGRSKAYAAIQAYLGTNFSGHAARLKANVDGESRSVALSMGDYEEINEVYKGAKVFWLRSTTYPRSNVISFKESIDEKRAYVLSFRRKDRDLVVRSYLSHVLGEGKKIMKRGRRQRLYTNVSGDDWGCDEKMMWKCVGFDHPATFDTLAMDPKKKKEIMDDLIEFTKAKDYYKKIGKPWKRGYLLYGPPGTGKSTMIAAIANFLHYDVYDLELTAVKDNTNLRKIMIEISKRAIVVIEDIDCSLHITGRRKRKKSDQMDDDRKKDDLPEDTFKKAKDDGGDDKEDSKVTLSGLLNFMDGLWSASGGERIFVFTTNHVEKIDDALIRRGRMDKHIEMSYCCFEAFKVLAKNYLNLDSHEKFEKIRCLLSETEISTADVAENLMPTSAEVSADECLKGLIAALQKVKEEEESTGEANKMEEVREDSDIAQRRKNEIFRRFNTRIRRLLSDK